MTTGEKIQQLRKMNGLSQEQLAEKITVSRQAVSRWELGEALPDTDNIVQLGTIFNVSTDYLLHDDIDNETQIPIVKHTSKELKKRNRTIIILLLAVVVVFAAISYFTRSVFLMLWLFGAASFGLFVYVLYLIIRHIRRNTR